MHMHPHAFLLSLLNQGPTPTPPSPSQAHLLPQALTAAMSCCVMPLSTSLPGVPYILLHWRKECLIIFNQWTWHLARQWHLGGSNICLPPGAQLLLWMSAEHLRTWPSAARRPRLPPAWSPPERLPPGLILSYRLSPCHRPREALQKPQLPEHFPSNRRLPVITGVSNINVTLTQWPRSLPITMLSTNGSADCSSTENRYWLRSRPAPGEQGSAGCLENSGKKGEMCISGSSRSCPGWAMPSPTRSLCLRSSSSCHRSVPSTTSPKSFQLTAGASFHPAIQHVSMLAADAAAAPARPLSGAQATSYRKSRPAPA